MNTHEREFDHALAFLGSNIQWTRHHFIPPEFDLGEIITQSYVVHMKIDLTLSYFICILDLLELLD